MFALSSPLIGLSSEELRQQPAKGDPLQLIPTEVVHVRTIVIRRPSS